jgi:hypothetical protein
MAGGCVCGAGIAGTIQQLQQQIGPTTTGAVTVCGIGAETVLIGWATARVRVKTYSIPPIAPPRTNQPSLFGEGVCRADTQLRLDHHREQRCKCDPSGHRNGQTEARVGHRCCAKAHRHVRVRRVWRRVDAGAWIALRHREVPRTRRSFSHSHNSDLS